MPPDSPMRPTGATPAAPVRIAVIGAGLIGRTHVRLAAAEPACDLVAIVDPAPEAEALARQVGASWYADVQALLAAEAIDGAIVAVPNALHLPVGRACAAAGVHMIVEKPVADTVAAGLELVEAAEAAGVRMLVGHHRRYDPAVQDARTILQSGELGRLVAVSAIWSARKPDDYWKVGWRSEPGGGPILINLIHDIDCLRYLCGEIAEVQAMASDAVRGHRVEDSAAILFRFESGALGSIVLSDAAVSPWNWEGGTNDNPGVAWSGENSYRFMGTHASLEFPNLAVWSHAPGGPDDWGRPLVVRPQGVGPRGAHAAQLRHFCAVIRGDETPRIDGRDGLATLAAAMAVHEAVATGKPAVPASVGATSPRHHG